MTCRAKLVSESWFDYCSDPQNFSCPGCGQTGRVNFGDSIVTPQGGGTGPGPTEREQLVQLADAFADSREAAKGLALADRLRELGFANEAVIVYDQAIAAVQVDTAKDASLLARVHQGKGRTLELLRQTHAANAAFAQAEQLSRIAGMLSTRQRLRPR